MKKIDVYIDENYKFSSNKYKTCKDFKNFLLTKAFVFCETIDGRKLIELYNKKISCRYAD